jgi:DNA-binding winged helix-turn-helix (wHTH) protein/Tfp pilus assembly protein PilF
MSLDLKSNVHQNNLNGAKPPGHKVYGFGDYRLDVEHRMLYRSGTEIPLTPKQVETLIALIDQKGEIVSKEALMRRLWGDATVEESNLIQNIYVLRKVLGETDDGKPMIETLRRRGYRFNAAVSDHMHRLPGVSDEIRLTELKRLLEERSLENGTEQIQNASILDLTLETGAAYDQHDVEERKTKPDEPNVKNTTIGSLLSSRTILVASVSILVLVCFTSAAYYFRSSIGSRGARLISASATVGDTNNEEARRLYLQGINMSEERGLQNAQKALECLQRAVALDPNYAVAWAQIAHLHRDIAAGDMDAFEHYKESMKAIDKALAIDPNSSDAYSALCNNKSRYEYDMDGAETACKRALELDPDSALAHKTYANFLYSRGRFDEAIKHIKTAIVLQPISFRNQQMYGLTLYYARRYDEAEKQFKALAELNPNHLDYIYGWLITILEANGKEAEAFDYLIKKLTLKKVGDETIERFKEVYEHSGWRGVTLERIRTPESQTIPGAFRVACLYATLGDKDKAFENLEEAYQKRSAAIAVLEVSPQLDSLRDDPRFDDLIRRIEAK